MSPADRTAIEPPLKQQEHQEAEVVEDIKEHIKIVSTTTWSSRDNNRAIRRGKENTAPEPEADENDEDINAISLFQFQAEKRSLNRSLDEEVVFEKEEEEGGDDDDENQSCSSTAPTANSWSVLEDELTQYQNSNNMKNTRQEDHEDSKQDEADSEEDRKPAAIDTSKQFNNLREEDYASQQHQLKLPSQPIPTAASYASATAETLVLAETEPTSGFSTAGPPPLISPDQQKQLLAMSLSGHDRQKQSSSAALQAKKAPPPPLTMPKLPARNNNHQDLNSSTHISNPPEDTSETSESHEPTETTATQANPPPVSPPRGLKRQGGALHVNNLKPPPPQSQQIIEEAQQEQQRPRPALLSNMAMQRQRGAHNVQRDAATTATANVPNAKILPAALGKLPIHRHSNKVLPQPRRPHAPPFPVSDETKKLAAAANSYEKQQREKQRALQYKLKLEHQKKEQQLLQQQQQGGESVDSQDSKKVIVNAPPLLQSGRRQRRHTVMEAKMMSSIASADPAFDAFVSEPNASVASRHSVSTLAEKRKSLHKNHSLRVVQNTASFRSNRSGVSSVTMDPVLASNVARGLQQKPSAWGKGRTPFPRFSITNVTLDNPTSVHSSVGYNPDSIRSILDNAVDVDGSTHNTALQNAARSNGYHNYNPQLQPHVEGGSISTNNQSASSLDATTTIRPPNPEDFRRRQSQRRRSIQIQPMQRPFLPSVSGDDAQDVASQTSASRASRKSQLGGRRTSRNSTGSAGLRLTPPDESPEDNKRSVRRPDQIAFPMPRHMDPTMAASRAKDETHKAQGKMWDSILEEQNEIIMELACKLSQKQNEISVQERQQPDRQRHSDSRPASDSTPFFDHDFNSLNSISHPHPHPHLHPQPQPEEPLYHQQLLLQQQHQASFSYVPQQGSFQGNPGDSSLEVALKLSEQERRPGPEHIDSKKALEIALQRSRGESQSASHDEGMGTDASLDLAMAISQREALASKAPAETDERTMEVALELSKREYEYEVSHRKPRDSGEHTSRPLLSGPSNNTPVSQRSRSGTRDTALSYSDATPETSNNTVSLVMPSEMLEDDETVASAMELALQMSRQGGNVSYHSNNCGGTEDESFALAIALSRMDTNEGPSNATMGQHWPGNPTGQYGVEAPQGQAVQSHFQSRKAWYDGSNNAYSNWSAGDFRAASIAGGNDDSALRLAMELSYQDAYGTSMKSSSTTEDDSLELALALSRREAYGDGY